MDSKSCRAAEMERLLLVKLFNEPAFVELFDEARVREFFRFVLPDVRASGRDVFETNFHSR